jgi:hypothetical protein
MTMTQQIMLRVLYSLPREVKSEGNIICTQTHLDCGFLGCDIAQSFDYHGSVCCFHLQGYFGTYLLDCTVIKYIMI